MKVSSKRGSSLKSNDILQGQLRKVYSLFSRRPKSNLFLAALLILSSLFYLSNAYTATYPLGGGSTAITGNLQPAPYESVGEDKGSTAQIGYGGDGNCSGCQGVSLHSGEYHYSKKLLSSPGIGLPLNINLHYRSGWVYDGPAGWGWTHNYNLLIIPTSAGAVEYWTETGKKYLFTPSSAANNYVTPSGAYATLTRIAQGKLASGWMLTHPDGTSYQFNKYGKLRYFYDRYGNRLVFNHQPVGLRDSRIIQIADTRGGILDIAYYSTGRIKSFTYSPNRKDHRYRSNIKRWYLAYSSAGDLTAIRTPPVEGYSDGKDQLLGYDSSHNLISLALPSGDTRMRNVYSGDKVTSHFQGLGTYSFSYNLSQRTASFSNPLGNRENWLFDSTAERLPEERVELTSLGNYTTSFEHNQHGERIGTIFPRGNEDLNIFDQDNSDSKKRGNLLYHAQISSSTERLTTSYTYTTSYNLLSTATDPLGRQTTRLYDSRGNLTEVRHPVITLSDRQEAIESYTYNRNGQVLTHTDSEEVVTKYIYFEFKKSVLRHRQGLLQAEIRDWHRNPKEGIQAKTIYSYDVFGNQTTVTDPNGNSSVTSYDLLDRTIATRDSLGNRTTVSYDANDNPIVTHTGNRDENKNFYPSNPVLTTTRTYDLQGNLLTQDEEVASSRTTTRSYDAAGNLLEERDPAGNLTRYFYNERNQPSVVVRGYGTANASTTSYTYDANGNRAETIDPRGYTTSYSYDGFDRQTKLTQPLGNYSTIRYDAIGNKIEETSYSPTGLRLASSSYTYDQRDRLISTKILHLDKNLINQGVYTTWHYYDKRGLKIRETDRRGYSTLYAYDNLGRVIETEDPTGNEIINRYDKGGNLTSSLQRDFNRLAVDIEEIEVTFAYDVLNRKIRETDNDGNQTRYSYDSRGNLLRIIDREGNTTSYTYDGVGNRLREIKDLADSSGTPLGRVTTSYEYDSGFLLLREIDDKGYTTSYTYDSLNRISSKTNPDNSNANYVYDRASNLTRLTDENRSTASYSYDSNNRLTQVIATPTSGIEGVTQEGYSYDFLDRITQVTDSAFQTVSYAYDSLSRTVEESQLDRTAAYTFDANSNVSSIIYSGGLNLGYEYASNNLLSRIRNGSTNLASYSYVGGRPYQISYGNSTSTLYTYDNLARPTRINHQNLLSGSASQAAGFRYGYDNEGNALSEQRDHESNKSDLYSYDSLYRLTDVRYRSGESRETFAYDGAGNRETLNKDGTPYAYTANNLNQYTSIVNGGTETFAYDLNGNLTEDPTFSYSYDFKNRLIKVIRKSDSQAVSRYGYDYQNRRLYKAVWNGASYDTSSYTWSGWQIAEERVNGTLTASFANHPQALDQAVAMIRPGGTYYQYRNRLGNMGIIADSSGAIREYAYYEAYGHPTIKNTAGATVSSSSVGNAHLFTGQEYDQETGLMYYRNRYYSPTLGRFLTRDPLGFVDGMNLYEYVKAKYSCYKCKPCKRAILNSEIHCIEKSDALKAEEIMKELLNNIKGCPNCSSAIKKASVDKKEGKGVFKHQVKLEIMWDTCPSGEECDMSGDFNQTEKTYDFKNGKCKGFLSRILSSGCCK